MLMIMSNRKVFATHDLGIAIKQARRKQRLTQAALAEHANVSRGVVQKLEEGRGTVALENVLRLLHTLSLDLTVQPRMERDPERTPRG